MCVQAFVLLCCAVLRADENANPLISSMSFEHPVAIKVGNEELDLGLHAATRCYDWDNDGDPDLLVGGGDGRLWLYRNIGTSQKPQFEYGRAIIAGSRDRWGESYTGLAMTNLIGDSLPDLVVCHSGDQITIHQNIGTLQSPLFKEAGLNFDIQKNCQGRFDVADWDQDGASDLVTGSFGGKVMWYRNEGDSIQPRFGVGQPFHDISLAYNSHPRLLDFNHDERLDMLLGVNWGTVSLYLNSDSDQPILRKSLLLQWSDGRNLNIRDITGDDTTPELSDLDGDGVLDLISGGKNGRVFFMRGVGYTTRLNSFREQLARHARDLASVLQSERDVRDSIFGSLTSLQADLQSGLIPEQAREHLFKQLTILAKRYPTLLGRSKFDLESNPHLPILAGQFWTLVLESLPDSMENRQRVADTLDFRGGYRRLLVDFGVILIDNDTATPEHLAAMHRLMMAIPRSVWDVETITVAGWLGPAIKTEKIRSRSGINIFDLPLGRPENSFPDDSPRPGVTDVFLICLAHELAHNMLDTVGRRTRPKLYERKFECLAQAAGSDVVFRSPYSGGIDFAATKANFMKLGAWDGNEDNWNDTWRDYFKDQVRFDRAYTRGNVHFFLNAPQEAFATLANQYFADSQLMLEFCKTRWDAGYRSNINQFLLIADYLSEGSNTVRFYTMRAGGDLDVSEVELARDSLGRIVQLQSQNSTAIFNYESEPLVAEFQLTNK